MIVPWVSLADLHVFPTYLPGIILGPGPANECTITLVIIILVQEWKVGLSDNKENQINPFLKLFRKKQSLVT